MKFGYIRVSTVDQKIDRQKDELKKITDIEEIFIDKSSGKNFERIEWKALTHKLRKHDTVVVYSLDRLSRNKQDIIDIYKEFEEKEIYLEIINMPILSTYNKSEIERKLIQPIVIQLLGYIVEEERKTILERQRQGIDSAKKKGKHLGRPIIEITTKQRKIIDTWLDGNITAISCMKLTGLKKDKLYSVRKDIIEGRLK